MCLVGGVEIGNMYYICIHHTTMASNLKYDILIWSVGNVTALYNVSRKDCFPGLSPATGINLQNFHGNINRYFC